MVPVSYTHLMREIHAKGMEATAKDKAKMTVLELIVEFYARGFKFLPIDLYKSDSRKFIVTEEGLIPPFNSLQGLGTNAAQSIVDGLSLIHIFIAKKSDSQDICFIPDGDYGAFLERERGKNHCPGNFVDMEGNILGQHKGLIYYTVGQRKGLGIAFGKPMYVYGLDVDKNEVILCDNETLFSCLLYTSRCV